MNMHNRIRENTTKVGECWEWDRYRDPDGYGRMHVAGKPQLAHRVSYEAFIGPIPVGLEIDHLCSNRACVNPAHLEAVDHATNASRVPHPMKRVCINGHEQNSTNTRERRVKNGHLHRACRPCEAAAALRYKQRKAEKS